MKYPGGSERISCFGIDLTTSEVKPSACVCLNDNLQILFAGFLSRDSDIMAAIHKFSPTVIAIDSPLSLPDGLCCLKDSCSCWQESELKGRVSERLLAKAGIPCYFTTKKSIIRDMVIRGMDLKEKLVTENYQVMEVYPYATKIRLFGKLPRKTTAEGIRILRERLSSLIKTATPQSEKWKHDLCDACVAAYTGLLYMQGKTESVGDSQEGYIFIPDRNCGRKEVG